MKDPTKPTLREWSSLIGIITAIVGNILISLALNIQRYAHVRLRRQSNYHLATSTRNASERSAARDRQVQPKIGAQVAVYQGAEARHAVDRQHQLHVEISKAEERTRSSDTVGDGRYGVSPPTRLNIQRYAALEYTELTETPTYNIKFRTDENASPLEGRSGGRTGPASNHQSTPDEMTPLMRAGQSSSPAQPIIRDSDDSSSEDLPKSYLKSPYWWLGFILMVVGEAGNFLAYGFAPASIVSPLGVVALVSNCVIAPVMLKEPFRRQDLLGVLVSVAGTATVVSSANPSESKMGPDAIWEAITRLEFEVYLGITCFLIVALACASPSYGHKSVLLDLGIVALAGTLPLKRTMLELTMTDRRLYGPLYKRCSIPCIRYALASSNVPDHICAGRGFDIHRVLASKILEQGLATVRLDTGYTHTIRDVQHFCHCRERCVVPGL